jgi:hypothetical protein
MHRRFARLNPFNPFAVPGLLFAAEGDDGGGTSETGTESTEDQSSEEQTAEGASTEQQTADTTDWKAMSRKWEKQAKADSAAAKELATLKAKGQTDAERLAEERDSANTRSWTAIRRAVTSEVKSVAAGLKFTDPKDALAMLDMDALTNDEGEVDDAALMTALKSIAKNKPYLLTTSGAGRSAVDHGAGGSGESGSNRPKSIAEALTRANAQ